MRVQRHTMLEQAGNVSLARGRLDVGAVLAQRVFMITPGHEAQNQPSTKRVVILRTRVGMRCQEVRRNRERIIRLDEAEVREV